MDMEQVLRQLQDTARVMDSIPAMPADVLKEQGDGLLLRRRLTPKQRQMVERNNQLMAEIQRMLDSLNRKPE